MILTDQTSLSGYLHEHGMSGRLPEITGRYFHGNGLIICADAACVWDDLEALGCRNDEGKGRVFLDGFDFMCVNKIGETFPGDIEHWYSNSMSVLARFMAARRDEYSKEFEVRNTHALQSGVMWKWPWTAQGTSLLGATLSGFAMAYRPIIICGGPLDDGPHNGEPPWRRTKFASSEAKGEPDPHWAKALPMFKGTVKSMSGRTREWLGGP